MLATEQAYKQKLKWENLSQKVVQCWSEAKEELLRGSLELVDLTVFKNSAENLDEYSTTITDFITKCVVDNPPVPSIIAAHVKLVFLRVNPRKATGPKMVPNCALRSSEGQLAEIFTDIFKLSLPEAEVLTCFKKTTIIPVPKKAQAVLQSVRIDNCISSTITLNTGDPQVCILSPLLYSLYIYDFVGKFRTNAIYRFANDTTMGRGICIWWWPLAGGAEMVANNPLDVDADGMVVDEEGRHFGGSLVELGISGTDATEMDELENGIDSLQEARSGNTDVEEGKGGVRDGPGE
eukprot:g41443.t1